MTKEPSLLDFRAIEKGMRERMEAVADNTLDFVLGVMRWLAVARIDTWLSGGWTEEILGITPPRRHGDVDLLYRASDFRHVDAWIEQFDVAQIVGKRFSHKRAVLCQGVVVELALVEPTPDGYVTRFFDGRYEHTWPDDTFDQTRVGDSLVPVASASALRRYRERHALISRAYEDFRQQRRGGGLFEPKSDCEGVLADSSEVSFRASARNL